MQLLCFKGPCECDLHQVGVLCILFVVVFNTCGFIQVTVFHAWYEVEELGEIALCHANGGHNLDSTTVGMGWVVVEHRHWTNPSNHSRSTTSETT